MSEFIFLINQNGNPAKTTPETWANVRVLQPSAREITEAEYNKLTNPDADIVDVVITEPVETDEVETPTPVSPAEIVTNLEEVEEILQIDEYNKTILIHAIYKINPTSTITINDKKAVLIAELQKFSDEEVKSALDSYVTPTEPVDIITDEVVEAVTEIETPIVDEVVTE